MSFIFNCYFSDFLPEVNSFEHLFVIHLQQNLFNAVFVQLLT